MSGIYDVAVKISLVNNVSAGLAIISKEVLGLEGSVKKLQTTLNNLTVRQKALFAGGLSVAGGVALGVALKDIADHAKELNHELTQLQKLNLTEIQIKEVREKAVKVTEDVPGTNEVEALKVYGNAYSMFGHDGALKLMRALSEFAQVSGNTSGNYDKAAASLYQMLRAGDLLGAFVDETTHKVDPAKLEHFLDIGARALLISHGKVDSATWLGLIQQGGPAMSKMSDRGLMGMAIASQAMGGPRAGTAVTSLYQQMVAGKMTESSAKALKELGLVGDYKVSKGGHLVWAKGALDNEFTQKLQEDPIAAVQIMQKKMQEHGLTTIDQQVPKLFEILGRQTTQRLVHDMLRNMPQIIAEINRMEGAMKVPEALKAQNDTDIEQNEHNLAAAWKDLMFAVAGPNSENYVAAIKALTGVVNSLNDTIRKIDPGYLQKLGLGLALLSGVLVLGGGVTILAALGPAGWLTLGIGSLALALFFLRKSFTPAYDAILAAMGPAGWVIKGFDAIATALGNLKDPMETLRSVLEGISNAAAAAGKALSGLVNTLTGGLGLTGDTPGVRPRGVGTGVQPSHGPRGPIAPPLVPGKQSSIILENHTHTYVDGQKVASAMERRIVRDGSFPTRSPSYDGFTQPSYG